VTKTVSVEGKDYQDALDKMNERRRIIISRYLDGIKGCRHIQPLLPYELKDSVYWIFGVRPNSPDHQIIVLSNKPLSERSCINAAIPLSISGNLRLLIQE
jgi:hypothetical protein